MEPLNQDLLTTKRAHSVGTCLQPVKLQLLVNYYEQGKMELHEIQAIRNSISSHFPGHGRTSDSELRNYFFDIMKKYLEAPHVASQKQLFCFMAANGIGMTLHDKEQVCKITGLSPSSQRVYSSNISGTVKEKITDALKGKR